jgi:hypothetical protein
MGSGGCGRGLLMGNGGCGTRQPEGGVVNVARGNLKGSMGGGTQSESRVVSVARGSLKGSD